MNHPSPLAHHRKKGFTLVELLVALAVFAVMAVAAYRGLGTMLEARQRVEQENQKWRAVALFFSRLENDLEAVLDRPVRGASGLPLPALSGKTVAVAQDEAQLAFTRSGYGAPSAPRRVGYRLRGETLELLSWEVLDQGPRSGPDATAALKEVTKFDLRYLDRNGSWQQQWPPAGQEGGLPTAVEVRLRLGSGEEVERLFSLS